MSRKNPSLLEVFAYLPWWASAIASIVVYIALKFLIPDWVNGNQITMIIATAAQNLAWMFGGLFIIPAVSSIFKRKKRQQLLNKQRSTETLRATHWHDFELLVGEAFRRKGFSVQENMAGGADGGIDLRLHKNAELHIVQCKQWRSSKVGVSIVREMFGVMTASQAKSVYVVSSGYFTNDAIKFAQNLPIELINGEQLLKLIADVQTDVPIEQTEKNVVTKSTNQCPKCSSPLVKRIAKKGAHIGNEFMGCSSFPQCRYVR